MAYCLETKSGKAFLTMSDIPFFEQSFDNVTQNGFFATKRKENLSKR